VSLHANKFFAEKAVNHWPADFRYRAAFCQKNFTMQEEIKKKSANFARRGKILRVGEVD
jgi:hypothetical protein